MVKTYVNYNDSRWKKIKLDINNIVCAAVSAVYNSSEVSVVLTNDAGIRKINKKYRGINKSTNVLSFELGDPILMGDIYISFDTVQREAKEMNVSMEEHFAHMIIHGVLHLQGYDHISDDDAIVMQEKEIAILKKLNFYDPYVESSSIFNKYDYCFYALFGVIASFGFAPFNLWCLSVIGLVGAYVLTVKKRDIFSVKEKILRILPFGFFYGIGMFWWVINSIYVVPELTKQFAIWTVPILCLIGFVSACFFSVPFVILSCVRQQLSFRALLFSVVCALMLWLREWIFTGFPWNPFCLTLQFSNTIFNSMALWGSLGLTFVFIGLLTSLTDTILDMRLKYTKKIFFMFLFLFVIGGIYGHYNIIQANKHVNESPLIRIVQPAMSAIQKASYSEQRVLQNAQDNLQQMYSLATTNTFIPDLLVFPETVYPFVITDHDLPFVRELNNNVIMGATVFVSDSLYNSMILAYPDGKIFDIYNKTHLVPFGEYRPLGDIIMTPGMLTKGTGARILTMRINNKDFSFVPAICYEIIFSDSLTNFAFGNEFGIINITNDTWFGKTPGTYQHLNMVRRYAIESGLPVIRANYSGISAFILSDGSILSSLNIGETGSLDGTVWGAHNTIYRIIGLNGWMIIILVFSLFVVISICEFQKID